MLSRKEGLDPDLREAFARSGTAHLLAISGFHVGVVAGLLLALLRAVRLGAGRALLVGAGGVWGYVLVIGAPDAAVRAAILLSLAGVARAVGRPLAAEGGLAAAFLLLATLDPGAPGRPGFQLSFAGAAGLARLAPLLAARLRTAWAPLPSTLRSALAAGVGATLATLPVVAWHFERISLVGIPGTVVAGPLVALAIPGLLLVLLAGPLSEPLGSFLAGGTELVLVALVAAVEAFAAPSWASLDVGRAWVLAAAAGAGGAALLLMPASRLGRGARSLVLIGGAAAAVLLAPVARAVGDRATVGIEVLDVGQGDAILLRSPGRRWLLVDAGPRSGEFDAGLRRILPVLRRRGIRRLEALVLTHPDLDHVGGAAAVLEGVRVGAVLDPGHPRGTDAFIEALEAAGAVGTPWSATARGMTLRLDGMTVEVLHPDPDSAGALPSRLAGARRAEPNALSVILLVRHGAFTALLTGDAPREVEERIAAAAGSGQLLKVAHHGSGTSSSREFLEQVSPALALVSVGRGNRYGHPAPEVLARLEGAGARVLRTDVQGALAVRAREDGSWTLSAERGPD